MKKLFFALSVLMTVSAHAFCDKDACEGDRILADEQPPYYGRAIKLRYHDTDIMGVEFDDGVKVNITSFYKVNETDQDKGYQVKECADIGKRKVCRGDKILAPAPYDVDEVQFMGVVYIPGMSIPSNAHEMLYVQKGNTILQSASLVRAFLPDGKVPNSSYTIGERISVDGAEYKIIGYNPVLDLVAIKNSNTKKVQDFKLSDLKDWVAGVNEKIKTEEVHLPLSINIEDELPYHKTAHTCDGVFINATAHVKDVTYQYLRQVRTQATSSGWRGDWGTGHAAETLNVYEIKATCIKDN